MQTQEASAMQVIENTVQQIFAETTRYPLEVLDPTANLEDDLGIDSVKRSEILLALQKRFGLPTDLHVPLEMLTTIRNITTAIGSYTKDGAEKQQRAISESSNETSSVGEGNLAQQTNREPAMSVAHPSEGDIEKAVISIFAETTRYPAEVLDPMAHLEDDLGIDSVKRSEILLALQKRFGLPPDLQVPPEMLTTIRDITAAIGAYVKSGVEEQRQPVAVNPQKEPFSARQSSGNGSITGSRVSHQHTELSHSNARLIAEGHKPFTGKVALVTGSGHGIGRAIALRIAALGASVVVNSFHSRERGDETVQHIQEEGGDAVHLWGSVANQSQLQHVFDQIDDRLGHLDFFVSNSSNGIIGPLRDVTEEQWKRAFQTNVIGLHQGALRAAELMKRRGGGKIVTLSSPGAHRHIRHFGCMGPIKAAVESLSLYLAVEFADLNIQVNCISAGPVYGTLLSKYPDSEHLIPYWESLSAQNRLTGERDVADLVTYLLSSGSDKMTGSVVLMDAGGSRRI